MNVGSRVLIVMYHVDCTYVYTVPFGCYILLIFVPLLYFWVTVSVHLQFSMEKLWGLFGAFS